MSSQLAPGRPVPALDGFEDKLRAGAWVADIGCGEGAPTLLLAAAFPASTFAGFDANAEAIATARKAAAKAGFSDRVTFETAWADATPGHGNDLVCTFDAIHDMGDPAAVARHIKSILAPGGVWMIVDRNAADSVSDNFHVVGRLSYSASCFLCVPSALAQANTQAIGHTRSPAGPMDGARALLRFADRSRDRPGGARG